MSEIQKIATIKGNTKHKCFKFFLFYTIEQRFKILVQKKTLNGLRTKRRSFFYFVDYFDRLSML